MALGNGLYKVSFGTPLGEGFGVIVLRDGEVLGGDGYYRLSSLEPSPACGALPRLGHRRWGKVLCTILTPWHRLANLFRATPYAQLQRR